MPAVLLSCEAGCRILPQIYDTLNMLCNSRLNNNLTMYENIKATFDWNKTPSPPLGTKAILCIATDYPKHISSIEDETAQG